MIDLKIFPNKFCDFSFFDKLKDNKFKLLYLLSSDNLEIDKKNEFIIYQGSHGDRGAEIADIILPSAAYTEQNGLYENLEGRVQECRKASFPINEAKEDWKIFNLILKKIKSDSELLKFENLRTDALKHIENFSELNELPRFTEIQSTENENNFVSEEVAIKPLDYYFSNSIARSSKTMSDCRQIRDKTKKTGTDN